MTPTVRYQVTGPPPDRKTYEGGSIAEVERWATATYPPGTKVLITPIVDGIPEPNAVKSFQVPVPRS